MRLFTTILLSFLFLAAYGQHSHRNCGTMEALEQQLQQDPEMRNRMEAIERHTERYIQGEGVQFRTVITIPVVFHIAHNGDALGTNENISDALEGNCYHCRFDKIENQNCKKFHPITIQIIQIKKEGK